MGSDGRAAAQTSFEVGSGGDVSSASYNHGPSLPDLSADQIAQDVRTEYNRRTGEPEAVGPTFDPFEQDDDLAGRVSLRTMDHARDLDGRELQDGVLLDLQLYYTDYGDRSVGRTRDAVFLNGEPAPVVLSDSRELECSSRVTETIYHYDRYYSPGYGGLYRPRPTYFGHSLFDIHIWGGGYSPYYGYGRDWRRRYRGHRGYRDYRPTYRPSHPVRPRRPVRPRPHRPSRVDRRSDDRLPPRELTRTVPGVNPRRSRVDHFINGRPAGSHDKYRDRDTDRQPDRRPRRTERRRDRLPDTVVPGRGSAADTARPSRRERERRERVSVPRPSVSPPPRREAPPARTKPRPETSPPPRRQSDKSPRKPIQHNMFPDDRPRDGVIISSDRDCAREDRLTVFIPYERLDAARFDGLTLIIRDVSYDQRIDQTTVYDERALYIPPNYVEGFRRGA